MSVPPSIKHLTKYGVLNWIKPVTSTRLSWNKKTNHREINLILRVIAMCLSFPLFLLPGCERRQTPDGEGRLDLCRRNRRLHEPAQFLLAMDKADTYSPPGLPLPTVAHNRGHGITSLRVSTWSARIRRFSPSTSCSSPTR